MRRYHSNGFTGVETMFCKTWLKKLGPTKLSILCIRFSYNDSQGRNQPSSWGSEHENFLTPKNGFFGVVTPLCPHGHVSRTRLFTLRPSRT